MRASLRRPDWLYELQGLLAVTVVLAVIGAVVKAAQVFSDQPLNVSVGSAGLVRSDGLPSGVRLDSEISLQIDHPSGVQRSWELLATLPGFLLVTLLLVLLWRLIGQARRTDPFTGGTVRRLRVLGLLLVAGGPVVWLLEALGRVELSATVSPGELDATLNFATLLAWILCGFGLLAIGEIVRRGQALRTELDGVV